MLITAKAAAAMLGVSVRMMYSLAAPHGPIPCVRYGTKCVRFNPDDIETHIQACKFVQSDLVKKSGQSQPGKQKLKKSSQNDDNELHKLFRELGIKAGRKPTGNKYSGV